MHVQAGAGIVADSDPAYEGGRMPGQGRGTAGSGARGGADRRRGRFRTVKRWALPGLLAIAAAASFLALAATGRPFRRPTQRRPKPTSHRGRVRRSPVHRMRCRSRAPSDRDEDHRLERNHLPRLCGSREGYRRTRRRVRGQRRHVRRRQQADRLLRRERAAAPSTQSTHWRAATSTSSRMAYSSARQVGPGRSCPARISRRSGQAAGIRHPVRTDAGDRRQAASCHIADRDFAEDPATASGWMPPDGPTS